MIEWKLITSDDELPKEAILVSRADGFECLLWSDEGYWYLEDACCYPTEFPSPSTEFTHWSEINIPK